MTKMHLDLARADSARPETDVTRKNLIRASRVLPRGLCRVEAAQYIGVSTSLFDEMVSDGRMPSPKRINTRTVWDIRQLDLAFDALPNGKEQNPWDDAIAS
jgi:hypothetical protein